jgi:plastocyanin
VRPRRRYVLLAALLGLATAMLPAIASSETSPTVEAVNEGSAPYPEHHRWSPAQATVMAGGVVTFSNPGTVPHGVEWVGGPEKPACSAGVPVGTTEIASGGKWSGTCTFSQPGTYTFYCTVHHAEMTGTITVSASGTTTVTTTPTTTPTTTTTTTTPQPSGSPLVGGPSLRSTQRGGSVRGSLEISQAGDGDRLEIDVLVKRASLATAKHAAQVRVGRFARGSVSAGRLPFVVKLDSKARRAVKRHHRLALVVKIVLAPFYGESTTVTRSVLERG